jgi:hypothetical protein
VSHGVPVPSIRSSKVVAATCAPDDLSKIPTEVLTTWT